MEARKGKEIRIISNTGEKVIATSDKSEGKGRKVVRSRSNFGQVYRKRSKSCPNLEQLRTSLEEKYEKLAEVGVTSDKFRVKV